MAAFLVLPFFSYLFIILVFFFLNLFTFIHLLPFLYRPPSLTIPLLKHTLYVDILASRTSPSYIGCSGTELKQSFVTRLVSTSYLFIFIFGFPFGEVILSLYKNHVSSSHRKKIKKKNIWCYWHNLLWLQFSCWFRNVSLIHLKMSPIISLENLYKYKLLF